MDEEETWRRTEPLHACTKSKKFLLDSDAVSQVANRQARSDRFDPAVNSPSIAGLRIFSGLVLLKKASEHV